MGIELTCDHCFKTAAAVVAKDGSAEPPTGWAVRPSRDGRTVLVACSEGCKEQIIRKLEGAL